MIRVLMVCLGNICRSPMAEAIFRHKVAQAGLEKHIEVDSAGTGDWHIGEAPHKGTCRVLDAAGISYTGMKARQILETDLDDWDYILTMDEMNLADVRALRKASDYKAVVRPLLEYAPQLDLTEVPDPYYTGGFDGVFEMVDIACDGLLAAIRQEQQL